MGAADRRCRTRLTALDANGMMTDGVLARIAGFDHVTTLLVAGSRQLTDDGLRHLAGCRSSKRLDLTGVKLTDRGMDVLQHLPAFARST